MSNSEMVNVSQKMEAEFREMLLNEKMKKKRALEGPSGVQGMIVCIRLVLSIFSSAQQNSRVFVCINMLVRVIQ